jgi:hypothetical protein
MLNRVRFPLDAFINESVVGRMNAVSPIGRSTCRPTIRSYRLCPVRREGSGFISPACQVAPVTSFIRRESSIGS